MSYIFGTLSLVLAIFASLVVAKCPSGTFQGIQGDCFSFNNTKTNWLYALDFCSFHQGTLTSIDSALENAKITNELKSLTNNVPQKVWLGGYVGYDCDPQTVNCHNQWVWVDDADFYYDNWDVNGNSGDMQYGLFTAIDTVGGTWFAVNGTIELAFICKYPPGLI
uniref:C-type lectin domain-containing protein n=1 Tax=Acrobeloides nanus TaxID=290746 RepID=A0A914ENK8_9BILA